MNLLVKNMTKTNKYKLLHELKDKMEKDDSLPLKKGATKLVFGAGNTEAKILCIGEGPGRTEDQTGLPFVGQAGKLLDKFLSLANLDRKSVFITNIVHHRPPDNRDPEANEISAYGKYLDEIIEIIDPEIVLTLGRFSMAKFLPNVFISGVHGKKHVVTRNGKDIVIIPMYHPAASLRNGNILESEKNDFYQLKEILRRMKDNKEKVIPESEQMNLV
ncbi:MAG: Phage SPO1 DNA polymerase-related protein [Microgenomates group bacterium GW2011_GWC1_41_20]|uniref:Type-4 uracil-DNA glycosylase n=6 Tax=Candidatus Woeseibacteriota TaxID=1752722 RepID=A0A0G0RU51_9BACT|nr:MAG: Phage SPO1 DNA polymerase-related protein [Candidatus Woesebacteria bacterium GW2011_GWF1_40_24]KKR91027.1 MAG: Phage SPO1 DNA polymerase-related protein [Candidatus Woesebacteria bacterium GW2011_GWD1_41_12]KKS00751.1 MAG: Phage SPO1 DNA polymerase-related protein [Microgenomates group bacterium GW2011_GWC1_41_20]KKS05810.1 MAG: Phage SPO1 DNA polymerase-related protein [Candidatus Woesebacteria bacterium GW2011_GWE1_41_24]KKS18735.1 MAG: Phage SPO1 DNA polymerase-related protein [Cand